MNWRSRYDTWRHKTRKPGPSPRPGITRVVVVDHRTKGMGRVLDLPDVIVQEAVQDDGRTLKIFVRDAGTCLMLA